MTRDTSIGATRSRLEELGYAVTSATHPDRILDNRFHHGHRRAGFRELAQHPAAVLCYPTQETGVELDDAAARQVVLLTVTAYLLADPRQAKAVMSALDEYKLTSGPYLQKSFGDRIFPLQYHGKEPIYSLRARLVFDSDDVTVSLDQAIPPGRFDYRQTAIGSTVKVALDPVQSQILPLDGGDWTNGHLLDTPRRNLPELFGTDAREIISDVECARWQGRPAAAEAKRA